MGINGIFCKVEKLTLKQQRFVNFYEGNASEAALKAGYSKKTAPFIGAENLKKPQIISAIRNRTSKQDSPKIMSRLERQAFWSEVALDKFQSMSDRLRAAELLGKSEADFTDNHHHSGALTVVFESGDSIISASERQYVGSAN